VGGGGGAFFSHIQQAVFYLIKFWGTVHPR
jgi:hypothetical protein